MPTRQHHRARVVGTLGAAAAHAYLAIIGVLGLLNYTVPTRYQLVEEVAADNLWVWIHGTVAVLLVAVLYRPLWHPRDIELPIAALVCNLGFAAMGTWAFFNLVWGLTTTRPVSLAGPGLAFVVAAGEQILANAWTRRTQIKDR